MNDLWTNTSVKGDFVLNGINHYQADVNEVFIAVAFFTEEQVIREILANDCHIKMVVRLGFPTNPYALKALLNNKNIEIRYFTGRSFHPKLYIFGDKVALVGSANLTRAAVTSNQEVVVSIEYKDPRFSELDSLFLNYWKESKVLTEEAINTYEEVYKKHKNIQSDISKMDTETESKLGKHVFSNISWGKKKQSKENIFIERYQKTYQEAVSAYQKILTVYESIGKRKNNSEAVPIRVEIDSFFSFIRDTHAKTDNWENQSIGWNDSKKKLLEAHIYEWLETDYPHFDETIIFTNYPLITKVFKSEKTINDASYESIVEGLVVLHSFHDRLRFFSGGLDTHIKLFKQKNELSAVKQNLIHLLFGENNIINRMADLRFDSAYKIHHFGESNIQELIGWVNKENLPVVNGRTTKVLRYYGFDVKQL